MKTERMTPVVLSGLLIVQTVFLGILLLRINVVEKNVLALYDALLLVSGATPLVEDVVADVVVDDRPFRGSPEASITIVEFSDFTCPACKMVQPTLGDLLERHEGQVRLVYRHFAWGAETLAFEAAVAAECADQQGAFWEMHDVLYANQDVLSQEGFFEYASDLGLDEKAFADCLASDDVGTKVHNDALVGQGYGVNGTPTFFINGRKVSGSLPLSLFEALIEEELGY
jgi:protein-disulfide isomerase